MAIICQSIHSQSVISRIHNTMRSGDILSKAKVDYINPGNAGRNSIWFLGKVNDDSDDFYQSIVAKGDTIAILEKGGILHYFMRNDTLTYKGEQHSRSFYLYNKERPIIKFPFAYGDSISGDYYGHGRCENLDLSIQGWGYTVADGIGILTDGEDSLKNITRLHMFDDYVEEYDYQTRIHFQRNYYIWYCLGYRYPVMESFLLSILEEDDEVLVDSATFLYLPVLQQNLKQDDDNDSILCQLSMTEQLKKAESSSINCLSELEANFSTDGRKLIINYTLSQNTDIQIMACDILGSNLGSYSVLGKEQGTWQECITLNRRPIGNVLMLYVKCGKEVMTIKVYHS